LDRRDHFGPLPALRPSRPVGRRHAGVVGRSQSLSFSISCSDTAGNRKSSSSTCHRMRQQLVAPRIRGQ
jgi:hypothetical protein